MNHVYSIIYNAVLGQYQVASEKTKTRRAKAIKLSATLLLGALLMPAFAVDINDGAPAVNVSANLPPNWANYTFNTTYTSGQFGFDALGHATNLTAIKSTAPVINNNVLQYFNRNQGYLNINQDTTFTFTPSTSVAAQVNIGNGQLLAMSVAEGKNLKFQLPLPTITDPNNPGFVGNNNTAMLFNVEVGGTLILQSNQNSSITISGFSGSRNASMMNNEGNIYLGNNLMVERTSFDHANSLIRNSGNMIIGDNAVFKSQNNINDTITNQSSNSGPNRSPVLIIGNNATFEGNGAYRAIASGYSGRLIIGDDAIFKGYDGLVIEADGLLILGDRAVFENLSGQAVMNVSGSSSIIGNDALFKSNTSDFILTFGADNISIGSGVTFENNISKSNVIWSTGNLHSRSKLGSHAVFIGNTAGNSTLGVMNIFTIDLGTQSETTLFRGNLTNNQPNSMHNYGTVNITGAGTLDMRDPFVNDGIINYAGTRIWKLGGVSTMNSSSSLNINSGVLYLYAEGEQDNANKNNASARVGAGGITGRGTVTFASGSKLVIGGGNTLSGNTLVLNPGITLGFKLADQNYSIAGAALNTPVLTWDFRTVTYNNLSNFTVDVLGTPQKQGRYFLLKSDRIPDFNTLAPTLKYFGHDANSLPRLNGKLEIGQMARETDMYLDLLSPIERGVDTWNNTDPVATWNVANENWNVVLSNGGIEKHFLSGDTVIFGDLGLANQAITVDASHGHFDVNGMTVDSTTNFTFSGDPVSLLPDTTLVKRNTGALTFNNHISGNVDLQGGTLIVGENRINRLTELTGDVNAHAGTTVAGFGMIEGVVSISSNAIIAPGNSSVGTLTVGGLNLASGSVVQLDVNPNRTGDKIIVEKLHGLDGVTTGNITIAPNVNVQVLAAAGQWAPSTSYTFLTSEGVISGAFAGATTNLAFLTPTVQTNEKDAVLTLSRNAVRMNNYAITRNQRAVADALEFLPHYNPVFKAVIGMSGDQARLAYDNLSGELYASTQNALFQNASRLQDGMVSRIHESDKGVWATGWGYDGHIKNDGNAAKVQNRGAGFLLGYDMDLNPQFSIGAAVGFEDSKIKIKDYNRQGENKVKSTHLMVYGNADLDVVQLKAGLSYSILRFKANRYINVPTLEGNLHSKYHGHQIHAFIEGSKTFNILENYDVSPYLNIAHTSIKAKSFVEDGSPAALSSGGHTNNRTTFTLGVKNDWYFNTEKTLAFTADIGLKHHFGNKAISQRLNFINTDRSFSVYSPTIKRNSALIGLGFKGTYGDFTVDVGYQGEFNNRVRDHAFGAKVRWTF